MRDAAYTIVRGSVVYNTNDDVTKGGRKPLPSFVLGCEDGGGEVARWNSSDLMDMMEEGGGNGTVLRKEGPGFFYIPQG